MMEHVNISCLETRSQQVYTLMKQSYNHETWLNQGSDDGAATCVATPVWTAGWTPVVRKVATEGTAAMTPDMVTEGLKQNWSCNALSLTGHDMTWSKLPRIIKRCPVRLGMLRVLPILLKSCIYFVIMRWWYYSTVHRHGTWCDND